MLLTTGRAQEVRDLLDREEMRRNPMNFCDHLIPGGRRAGLTWSYRFPAYDWFDFCESAAAGRYVRVHAGV